MLLIGLSFAASIALASIDSMPATPATQVSGSMIADFEPAERYRFALGGESGQYTNAERDGLDHFDGLSTTIHVDEVKGKPGDKWSSLARINLFGPGEGKDRKLVSLFFFIDRTTHRISTEYQRSKDFPRMALQKELSIAKPIEVVILATTPGKLRIGLDGDAFDVDCDLDIKGVSAIGSGVDVLFEPFVMLRRKR